MPEPITFTDYEFTFINGRVLSVTVQDGRDVVTYRGGGYYEEDAGEDWMELTTHHDGGQQTTRINISQLIAIQEFKRVEQPEPVKPEDRIPA